MITCISTLEYFNLEDDSNIEITGSGEVKDFTKEILSDPAEPFINRFLKMALMPTMLLKQIAELFGCGSPGAFFVRNAPLAMQGSFSPTTKVISWLCWLMSYSAPFTRSFIDRFKNTTDVMQSLNMITTFSQTAGTQLEVNQPARSIKDRTNNTGAHATNKQPGGNRLGGDYGRGSYLGDTPPTIAAPNHSLTRDNTRIEDRQEHSRRSILNRGLQG